MDNLITIFMNYKVSRLIEYGVVIYQKNSSFIRGVFSGYFQTYIDNYYYGIFNTIDADKYSKTNLKLEFNGLMEEMIYEYEKKKDEEDPIEYQVNMKAIKELKELAYDIIRIDTLNFPNKDEIPNVMKEFVSEHNTIRELIGKNIDKLIRMVKDTYVNQNKLLNYDSPFFIINEKKFAEHEHHVWYELAPSIKALDIYRKGLVKSVSLDESFDFDKFECLVHKISLMLLHNFLENKETNRLFIELPDSLVSRGTIDERVLSLIDNPMFLKHVVLAVSYNTYLSHKTAFAIDVHFASIQDFSHINDVYQKVDSIYNEGFAHYLIVSDCKAEEKEFFMRYKNDVMSVLMFEEE